MTVIDFLQARLDQAPDNPTTTAHRQILKLYLDQAELATQPPATGASTDARLGALADVCQHLAQAYGWQPDAPTP